MKLDVSILAIIAISAGMSVSHADTKTKFLSTPDGAMTAYFDGPQCDTRIQLLFEAGDASAFDEKTTPASRLMGNATRVMSRQCEEVERIVSKGVVNGRVFYNGIAEMATDWELTEVGLRSNGPALSSDSETGQKSKFMSTEDAVAFADISAELDGNMYCVSPSDGSCIGEADFEGTTITARYLLDEDGTEASLTYPASDTNGALCSATNDVGIEVMEGNLSDEGRADYADMLRERVESGGDEVCTAFQKRDGVIYIANFDDEGRMMGDPSSIEKVSEKATLRLEE